MYEILQRRNSKTIEKEYEILKKPIMTCGHAANAIDYKGNHLCTICLCFEEKEVDIDETRFAKCDMCGTKKQSSTNLPFFKLEEDKPCDSYYCGCRGWD